MYTSWLGMIVTDSWLVVSGLLRWRGVVIAKSPGILTYVTKRGDRSNKHVNISLISKPHQSLFLAFTMSRDVHLYGGHLGRYSCRTETLRQLNEACQGNV